MPPRKYKKPTVELRCWDCIFSEPFAAQWNLTPDGKPITYHCIKDPKNIKRGLFSHTPACSDFKNKNH